MKLDTKYRVYDRRFKNWIYGNPFFGINQSVLCKDLETAHKYLGEIQEWTGLVDASGVEIYEGDIVQATAKSKYAEDTGIYEIIFNQSDCQFQLRIAGYSHGLSPTWGGWKSLKIVGNVVETPDLVPAPAER